MGLNGRDFVPAHTGPGGIMGFEVIGMKFDQARDQVVPLQILAGLGPSFADIDNLAVNDLDASVQDTVVQNDLRVGENGFRHVFSRSFYAASGCQEWTRKGAPRSASTQSARPLMERG